MKVLILDCHKLCAEGLSLLLANHQKDIETVYAMDYKTALSFFSNKNQPDLIILDTYISGINDFSIIDKFHQKNIQTPILVITETDSSQNFDIVIEKGASGVISKTSSCKIFLKAFKTVLNGQIYRLKQNGATDGDGLYRTIKVTSRQHQVLSLLSQGLLNKQIAHELSISNNTVKAHLHDIFKQLRVTNRTAAVNYAHKHGLL